MYKDGCASIVISFCSLDTRDFTGVRNLRATRQGSAEHILERWGVQGILGRQDHYFAFCFFFFFSCVSRKGRLILQCKYMVITYLDINFISLNLIGIYAKVTVTNILLCS